MNENGKWEFDQDGNPHYVPPRQTPAQRPTPRKTTKSGQDDWHWIAIVAGFIIFWPIGVALLLAELSGKWKDTDDVTKTIEKASKTVKNVARDFSDHYNTNLEKAEAREKAAKQAKKQEISTKKASRKAEKKAKKQEKDLGLRHGLGHAGAFRGWGIVLMAIFGFASVMTIVDELAYFISLGSFLESTIPLVLFFLLGAVLFSIGTKRRGKLKKFRKYLTMIGNQKSVYIPALAGVLGKKPRQITEDLEEMLDREFFPCGYIDAGRQTLVLEETSFTAPVEEEPEATDDTLRRIRAINDTIAHPEISAKIDRIEELTGKILKLLEEKPEKAGELRSFMNYYLPQTLKILENYAKLEAQGIQSGNIQEAKQKIEGMMDKLVEGYENQLDRLFANDVLDISADLKVMEQMMEKDGLAVENELKF